MSGERSPDGRIDDRPVSAVTEAVTEAVSGNAVGSSNNSTLFSHTQQQRRLQPQVRKEGKGVVVV